MPPLKREMNKTVFAPCAFCQLLLPCTIEGAGERFIFHNRRWYHEEGLGFLCDTCRARLKRSRTDFAEYDETEENTEEESEETGTWSRQEATETTSI